MPQGGGGVGILFRAYSVAWGGGVEEGWSGSYVEPQV